jgi:bile acid:Na+ symporter, BASS family
MTKPKGLLRNRDFIMVLALALGLSWGGAAPWTEKITVPLLMVVMTLATMGVSGTVFRSPRALVAPALAGVAMNYFVLGGFLLASNALLIHDEALRTGFVLVAAVPPAVAVLPFTLFLNGDTAFSLIGTLGAYLGALAFMPVISLLFLGPGFVDPGKLMMIMLELILLPLILSRIFIRFRVAPRVEPFKGTVTNWSFFVLMYTIVGLNREIFLSHPLSLVLPSLIAVASTFFLGWVIETAGKALRIPQRTLVGLVLLGTLKNYGLAGGLALTLSSRKSALPATISAIFMITYIVYLQFKKRSDKESLQTAAR